MLDDNNIFDDHSWLKNYITEVPDFPKPGVSFKDISPLLTDKNAFQYAIQKLAEKAWKSNAEVIVGIESRGFIFAAPVAFSLGVPFVPVRKKGKLPGEVHSISYDLEYGTSQLEIGSQAITENAKVMIIDDVLATGGSALAASKLVSMLGAEVIGFGFLIELEFLKARERFEAGKVESLLFY